MTINKPAGQSQPKDDDPPTPPTGSTTVHARGVNVGGDVAGDIYTGDVIHYYLDSIRSSPFPQFTTGIENFLTTYLGTAEKPVPFGGRDQQLQQLNDWLVRGKQQRLLLVAPAGRGKSALLARWSAQLIHQKNLDTVFMPISVRFNTNREDNTFVVLATRLAHFYKKQIPTDYANFTPQMWRGLVAEYLKEPLPDDRLLLLILDSLDEAIWHVAGDLLPLNLPATTRVVVSARYLGGEEQSPQPWLRRLEWTGRAETLELEVLDPAGVRDVLEKMDRPLDELGRNVDIVAELHRLSQGDPLLVELYVQDLWQRGEEAGRLRPEDLQQIQPGYQGYFDRWWQEQKRLWGQEKPVQEPLLRGILNLLVLAHGPLTMADLQELLPRMIDADSWLVKESTTYLSRFVIGDGQEQGYVFSHPKLADYFQGQLSWRDRASWRQHFLTWGERTLEALRAKQLRPHDVSSYLMQYYGRHLEEANAGIVDLLPLVSQEWMLAWHEKTGMYSGFLQDMERVWAWLQRANAASVTQAQEAPYIGQEILSALCRASVNSLADNVPDELLVALLQHRVWTKEQVIAYIRQRHDPTMRSVAFTRVLPLLPADMRENIAQEAFRTARMIGKGWRRIEVQLRVVPYLAEAERLEAWSEMLTAARKLSPKKQLLQVLTVLAPHLPKEVLTLMERISNRQERIQLLTVIAPYLPEVERSVIWLEELDAAQQIRDEEWRAEVLVSLAPHQPIGVLAAAREMGIEPYRARVLEVVTPYLPTEVLAAAQQLGIMRERIRVLKAVAPHRPDEVLTAAQEIHYEEERAQVLAAVAPHRPGEVLTAVRQIGNKRMRARVLAAVVPHLAELTRPAVLGELSAAAREIIDEQHRWRATIAGTSTSIWHIRDDWWLVEAAPHLAEAERSAILAEALTRARQISDESGRARALIEVLQYMAEAELPAVWTEVLTTIQQIHDESERAQVLEAMIPHLAKVELLAVWEKVLTLAYQRGREQSRTQVLKTMASYLIEPKHEAIWAEALAAARQIPDIHARVGVLTTVAPRLVETERPAVLAEALAAARKIGGEGQHAALLVAAAPYRAEEALAMAQKISNRELRAWVLAAVAPHLAEAKRPSAWVEALATAREIGDVGMRAQVLAAVVPHLAEVQRPAAWAELLTAVHQISDESWLVAVLTALTPHLPDEALALVRKIGDEERRAEVLVAVAPHRPDKVLTLVRELNNAENSVKVLAALAQHRPAETLAAAQELGERYRLRRDTMASTWNKFLPDEWLASAQESSIEPWRIKLLAIVAPYLEEERSSVLVEVLTAAQEIHDEVDRALVLVMMAPYQPGEVLAAARDIDNVAVRALVLAKIAPHLSGAERPAVWAEALAATRQIHNKVDYAHAMVIMSPHLEGTEHQVALMEALAVVREISDVWERGEIYASLSEHMLVLPPTHLYQLWQETISNLSRRSRSNLLSDLAALMPVIHKLGGDKGVADTLDAVQKVCVWWP